MRVLNNVRPTPEQLKIIARNRPGVLIIRGAAGSGKTTTALLRLRSIVGAFLRRKTRSNIEEPVRVLVLSYNRTLKGYIQELAESQIGVSDDIDLTISTFSKWAKDIIEEEHGAIEIIRENIKKRLIRRFLDINDFPFEYLYQEINYALGRFLPRDIDEYIDCVRYGRGSSPRVEKTLRGKIVNTIIKPYQQHIDDEGVWDWNDLAVTMSEHTYIKYDIIVVDEAQDLSANEIRAICNQLKKTSSLTFVVDSAQRIYAKGYNWSETNIKSPDSVRLKCNYRNTKQIAKFVLPLVEGIPIDDDATMPDFSQCTRDGSKPIVLQGRYSKQVEFVIDYINENIDLDSESVAFFHPLGGGWLDYLRSQLTETNLEYVELSRRVMWPKDNINIGLSTLHSAKGLEFDNVIIIGLNREILSNIDDEDDDRFINQRRLLAMGISRARNMVIIGYKKEDTSNLINYFDRNTYKDSWSLDPNATVR